MTRTTEAYPIRLERVPLAESFPLSVEVFGTHPQMAVVAGFHGHEWRTIGRLRTALNRTLVSLPDALGSHLRILNAHPLAVARRTRTSQDGVDINREFPTGFYPQNPCCYPAAQAVMDQLAKQPQLKIVWSFHGEANEPGEPAKPFYMYDTPRRANHPHQAAFTALARELTAFISADRGFAGPYPSGTHTGLDCLDLGNYVHEGYVCLPADTPQADNGSFESWAAATPLLPNVERTVLLEIPDYLSTGEQQRLIQLIIDRLVIPYQRVLERR